MFIPFWVLFRSLSEMFGIKGLFLQERQEKTNRGHIYKVQPFLAANLF